MDTSNPLHCVEVKNTHSALVKRIFAILAFVLFLMLSTTSLYSDTIYEESEYPIALSEIRILSEIIAEAEVNALEQSEIKTEKTQVSQINKSSQPAGEENVLVLPMGVENILVLPVEADDVLAQPVAVDNVLTQPAEVKNVLTQPAEVKDTLVASDSPLSSKPTLKNTKSTNDFYPQPPPPPKRITANLKFKGSDEERKVSALFSENYFMLINNPLNIVNLRAGLRMMKVSHDKGKDIEDVLLAGIDGIELCTTKNIICGSIRVAGHSDLMFLYQKSSLTVSIDFFGAN